MGDLDANPDVTVRAYLDYSSSLCRQYVSDVLPEIEGAYVNNGKIRYEHYDFPYPIDRWSWDVAVAARAVQDHLDPEVPQSHAGMAHFWEFTKLATEEQPDYSLDLLSSIADTIDPNDDTGDLVERAVRRGQYLPVVEKSRRQGTDRGVRGTPSVFVNGTEVDPTVEALEDVIESELQ